MGIVLERQAKQHLIHVFVFARNGNEKLCLIASEYPFNTISEIEKSGYIQIHEEAVDAVKVLE